MMEGLAACFAGLADPRETRRCDHQLIDILAIAVCAVIACAESWEDIELYGRSKQAWLKTFLARLMHRELRDRGKWRLHAGFH
jgi:DDE_Tnp_1-associated